MLASPQDATVGQRPCWIAEIGREMQIREIPNLLVPRKDGFWGVGTEVVSNNGNFERYIWAAPNGKKGSHKPEITPAGEGHVTSRDLLFVGNDYVAVKESRSATCVRYKEGS